MVRRTASSGARALAAKKRRLDSILLARFGITERGRRSNFREAKKRRRVLISKDSDFVELVQRFGPPPQLIWVTCGNVTNSNLKAIFSAVFDQALDLLAAGEAIVEIGSPSKAG